MFALLLTALCQAGDVAGEAQPDPPVELAVPPAPVRSPAEERATFALAPELGIELVAAEPLVGDPVQAVFDADGTLWVCEMRGYMPDIDGQGEAAPVGTIAVLTDTDGDGRMDARRVFLDGLVLPRAIAPCHGGALVLAPPGLFFARDTDGDGRADEREVILRDLGGIASPEHAPNALDFGLDNAWRLANAPLALRRERGAWVSLATAGGGQWGLSQDELGRAFFNTNWEPLRGDLFPSRYAARNPNLGPAAGANVNLCDDARTFPARVTPGVNRGYRAGTLRADGTLAVVTAACAPLFFRGDALPPDHRANVFVCEPAGNLVLRYVLEEDGLALRARRADEGREFLTSTDERFRPVNLASGPDGALYVVDLYRGVIQHRLFVTSYLRRQVEARGLATPTGLGRIWRVRARDAQARTAPALPAAVETDAELVALLDHPNGWTRDAARRLLVEGSATQSLVRLLRERVLRRDGLAGRLQALSALHELAGLDPELARRLLEGDEREVVLATLRRIETRLATDPELCARVVALGRTLDARLAHQVLLSLGAGGVAATDAGLAELLALECAGEERRTGALSGLGGRELEFLAGVLGAEEWREERAGRARLLETLAACVVREGRPERCARLVELAAASAGWQESALVQGTLAALPSATAEQRAPLRLAREPAGLATLAARPEAEALVAALSWPGHAARGETPLRALSPAEEARFAAGRELFGARCASCHLASGRGDPGKAPSLRGSPRVLGSPQALAALLVAGLSGPVPGFQGGPGAEMPAFVASDEELAAVATYLRREWDHAAEPVVAADAAAARARSLERARPWTLDDLARAFAP